MGGSYQILPNPQPRFFSILPSGVSAAQIIAGAVGDEARINSLIAMLGLLGGGTLELNGLFRTGDWIVNVESNVHIVAGAGGASIIPAKDTSNVGGFDWAIAMGKTAGLDSDGAVINGDGSITIYIAETGAFGPNDPLYIVPGLGGVLPTGLSSSSPYWLVNYVRGNGVISAQLSLTNGGAPLHATDIGTLPFHLFYTWFGNSNVDTTHNTVTLPSVGQRLPSNWPILFRASTNLVADIPAGLLGRPNEFYAINEVLNGNGTYTYQFAQNLGGSPVSITNQGRSGCTFSAVGASKNQVFQGISIDGTAMTGANTTSGLVQVQSCSYGVVVADCPSLIAPNNSAVYFRGSYGAVVNNGIVNTVGGVKTTGNITGLILGQNTFSGAAGGADVEFPAAAVGNVATRNKLTAGGINVNGGTGNYTSGNY